MCEKGAEGREIRKLQEETCAARVCNDGGCRDGAECLSRGGCGSGGFNRGRVGRVVVGKQLKSIGIG